MDVALRWADLAPQVRMPWTVVGDPTAPVVVALPGLSDGLMPLSEPRPRALLASASVRRLPFRVVAVSHRHPVTPGTTTRDLADDAAAFIEAQVDHPVVVTGHSMGGMVAQWLAARHPHLVRRLVLTATLARPDARFRATLDRWGEMVAAGAWRAFAADANAVSYTGSELLRRRLLLRLTRPPAMPHLVERHRTLTATCLDHDTRHVLGDVTCPTLVLAGSHDPVVDPAASRALAAAIPGAAFELLPGLAHGFPEQSPTRTYDAVASWLASVEEVPA